MHIETRIKWTLILSLVMSWQNTHNAVLGRVDAITFGKNYLMALAICWIGMYILHRAMIWLAFDGIRRQIESSWKQPKRRKTDAAASKPAEVTAATEK